MIADAIPLLVLTGVYLAVSVKYILAERGGAGMIVPVGLFLVVGTVFFPLLFRLVYALIYGYDPS